MPINSRPVKGSGPNPRPSGGSRRRTNTRPIPGLAAEGSKPSGSNRLFRDGESLDVTATADAPNMIHEPITGV